MEKARLDLMRDHVTFHAAMPTRHSLAPQARTQQGMVRSDKVHVVGITLARALLRILFSNVRLCRHTTARHDMF